MALIDNQEEKASMRVSRRKFVAGGAGALVVGFSLPKYIGPGSARAADLPPVNVYNFPPPAPVFPVPAATDGLAPAAIANGCTSTTTAP